ncbi:hypothetical protein BABINDRAFT_160688 [Babjeviella inositovora NRRL Y-12698]|uniref:Ubiquitination network signaling protein acrB n=1 Tax=Babjeviella inositovora NRRL Y-12698 TaxID=984486 RepID=A0A1E3QUG8_9ASCO|nr:uncharacterized protein BABINDRAFT_160688 [Babjeviella inositovora NRRL Y-12698]ODQ81329.1 hypothetical protein BABINDRAFT_160688 [Babjeviella inositovora NRRL Y-12698]
MQPQAASTVPGPLEPLTPPIPVPVAATPPAALLPSHSLIDLIAFLVIFLCFPSPVSCIVLGLHALSASSRAVVARLFSRLLHKDSELFIHPGDFLYIFHHYRLSAAFLFFTHLAIAFVLAYCFPVSLKVVHLFAHALAASTLAGSPKRNTFVNALLSSAVILALDQGYKYLCELLNIHFGMDFAPHTSLLRSTSLRISAALPQHRDWYRGHCLLYLTNVVRSALAVHTILLCISPLLKNIFLLQGYTKTLDQLASIAPDYPINKYSASYKLRAGVSAEPAPPVDVEPQTTVVVHVSPKIASSHNVLSIARESPVASAELLPAAFPETAEPLPASDLSLLGSVVSSNFYNYCMTSLSDAKRKKDLKWVQPLWSLIATARAMYGCNDVYSGEIHTASDTALVPVYDNDAFAAFVSTGYYSDTTLRNSRGFVNYIGETAVGFLLPGCVFDDGISVKVNGVMWYQVREATCRSDGVWDTLVLVSGLTPLSQYDIELYIYDTEEVLSSNIVSTTHNTTTVSQSKMTSPLITLQESLITTNENLTREKTKVRKTRKEITKKVSVLKKEIETLRAGLDNNQTDATGSADNRNWRKLVSLRANVSQVQDENKSIEEDVSRVIEEESEASERYLEEKRRFEAEIRTLRAFHKGFTDEVAQLERQAAAVSQDLASLDAKKEKFTAKAAKISADLQKILRDLEELKSKDISRRIDMRTARALRRDELIQEFVLEIKRLENAIESQGYGGYSANPTTSLLESSNAGFAGFGQY